MWQQEPTPDALLDARVAAGWRPTVTQLRDGAEIQGHAARLPREMWITAP